REFFVTGCLNGEGATRRICECVREKVEPKLRAWEVAVGSFEVLAGRKSQGDLGDLFGGRANLECFARDDVPWSKNDRESLVKQCQASGKIPASVCPCYAERVMSTTLLSDVARMELPGDAGTEARVRFEGRGREALLACLKPVKASTKKRRR